MLLPQRSWLIAAALLLTTSCGPPQEVVFTGGGANEPRENQESPEQQQEQEQQEEQQEQGNQTEDPQDCTDPRLVNCSGLCVDLLDDPDHCGLCDQTCSDDQVCSAGSCRLPGEEPQPEPEPHEPPGLPTSVPGDRVISEMGTDEIDLFCDEELDYKMNTFPPEQAGLFGCAQDAFAAALFAPSEEAMQICQDTLNACDPTEVEPMDEFCSIGNIGYVGCDLTVSDVLACTEHRMAVNFEYLDSFECTDAFFSTIDSLYQIPGCQLVETTCPGLAAFAGP